MAAHDGTRDSGTSTLGERLPRLLSYGGPIRRFLRRHGRKLWWIHSLYAAAMGAFVVLFARKGFSHARWLTVSLGLAWVVVVLFFRLFGSGAAQAGARVGAEARVRVPMLVMSYVLKNLYQGMLFFLLPFYWQTTTFDSANAWFVVLLTACAALSTMDLVFDRFLLRWRALAGGFHAFTLFAAANLVIPALLPSTRTVVALTVAAAVGALSFWTLHVPLAALRRKGTLALAALSVVAGAWGAYAARRWIPPVPMYVSRAAVGPAVLPDGHLAMEVRALDASVIGQLIAVTDVVVPGGHGDRLRHVWRREGEWVHALGEETSRVPGPAGGVRLRSMLAAENLPPRRAGRWTVDVETEDGQLVGRAAFVVTE